MAGIVEHTAVAWESNTLRTIKLSHYLSLRDGKNVHNNQISWHGWLFPNHGKHLARIIMRGETTEKAGHHDVQVSTGRTQTLNGRFSCDAVHARTERVTMEK